MATTAASFVPEDVMKLFAQSFASGASAVEAGQRIGLARQAQAQDFQLGTQKLELQSQELSQQANDNAAKIALQRENIAADTALNAQKISLEHQQLAKQFLLKEEEMQQDKLNFAEQIRARRAAEEAKRIELAANVEELDKRNKIEMAKLDIAKEQARNTLSYKDLALQEQRQKGDEAKQFRKMQFLTQQDALVRKEAHDEFGLVKPEYKRQDGTLDDDKLWEVTKARTNRLMDETGGSVQSYSDKEKPKQPTAPKEIFKPSGSLLVDVATADKMTKAMEGKKPGDTVTIDGKKYRVK